jgi:hypothetical protein
VKRPAVWVGVILLAVGAGIALKLALPKAVPS